jgi:formate dehydrogenase alpha subunit
MTNSIEEIENMNAIFVIGSNTTENHPVIGSKIKQAVSKGSKLIVADPRRIELAKYADLFLQINPGSNIALLNSMMNVIINENLQDINYIKERTENYEGLVELVKDYTPERCSQICGVDADDIRKAARLYAESGNAGIFYAMGITQHKTGTQGVMSVSNLALLCGNIGKESAGVNPLRGQNNVQGACDMGGLPNVLTGYQNVTDNNVIEKFEKVWNSELSKAAGLTLPEIMNSIEEDKIKFLYIMGENPMISDPDLNHIEKALKHLDFLVVQDIFLTETAEYANVVLPASSFAEKDGTFTNTERRVQRVRKAINPVGNSKPDWMIIMELMNKLGYEKTYANPREIMDEISLVTPQYGGISYDRLEEGSLQWPCPTLDHPGTKYLHKDNFAKGKATFVPSDYIRSYEENSEEYPYVLINGRILYHYHSRSMTGRVDGLNEKAPSSYIEINPITANKLGILDNEKLKISSKRGEIITTAKITDIIEEDIFFMPFHFADGAANYLTNTALDSISKIPDLKVCAINVQKVTESEDSTPQVACEGI